METTMNPLKVKDDLEKAKSIYNGLQEDIQKHLIEEYIKPELTGAQLIKEFDILIESEECQRLNCHCLLDVVGKIINHSGAFFQMCEKNTLDFESSYQQHFIKKINTFKHVSFHGKPLESMCLELVMRKWH